MAAETGVPSVYLEHQLSHGRATKKTQGTLIERLRLKNYLNRSWTDSIKSVRSSVAERRTQTQTDHSETVGVQKCLDTLQKAMKVISQQTLKERLDLIGRQLGLSSQIQDQKVSLGTDAFQVDVLLGDGGNIVSVKLANQGEVVEYPDLKDILKRGDFTEFIEHLQGLQSIYQVTNDEKLKAKAFLALQALEKDLNQLAQFQSSISGVANYIHKCPLGIMLPRVAGKPMKLIYFVSPYDLLDKKSLTAHPLTVEAITENFLGQSVTVCIEPVPESAPPNKLQTMPLMNVSKTQDGKSLPSFSGVSKINSMMLPASFVLVLPQSIPVSTQVLQKITASTGLEIHKEADARSLRSLILESFSNNKIKDCQELFVSLPDQQHIYFLNCLNGGSQDQQGVMVSRIPFTHPTHVPQILNLMRQQLLFNIVIASCIRPGARKDSANSIVFEVTAVSSSLQQLTIVFEHPAYDTMVTVDMDLTDITNLKCHVSCTNSDQILCSDEAISRVFQRCMSVPIMLRWLIGKGRGQLDKLKETALAAERERIEKALLLKEMQQRQAKLHSTILPTKERPPPQPPHPPPLPPPPSYHHHHSSLHHPQGSVSSNGQTPTVHPMLAETRVIMAGLEEFHNMTENNAKHGSDGILVSPDTEKVHNPLLSNLLDEEKLSGGGSQAEVHDSPMLSRLLDDNTSVATTVIPMNCKPSPTPPVKRPRKRRSQSDFSGPSPKHRISDNDTSDRLGSMDLDMGSNLMDQALPSTPAVMGSMTSAHGSLSHHHHHPMLNHATNIARSHGNVIDLTEDGLVVGESNLKKLADFIQKDVKPEQDLSMALSETESQSRIPNILQNSPSGSKNENASTSLEGYLKGSGEVGRAKDFDPSDAASAHNSTTFSKLSSLLLASTDSPSPVLSTSPDKANSSFFSDKLGNDNTFNMGKKVSNNALLQDMKPTPASLRKGALPQSSSVELPSDKQSIGIFEKFDLSRQQPIVKLEVTSSEVKTQPTEGKVSLKLRVGPLKQQNNVKPVMKSFNSLDEKDLVMGKSNDMEKFDFKSDEDDDDPLMQLSDRYVYSSSPTRLQISTSKQKRLSDSSNPQKSDKTKKKEKGPGNTTKRKREKDESKRERKRKKNEHIIQESVYRTVENDAKADFKLKIRVAKKPMSSDKYDVYSDGKVTSYEISKKTLPGAVDKLLTSKHEVKESVQVMADIDKERESSSFSKSVSTVKSAGSVHKSSKMGNSKAVQGGGLSNKTDPKLVTKATIRLKPVTMPDSGSTVNISQSGPKNTSGGNNKSDRRSSTSTTPVSEKRSAALNSQLERRGSSSNLVDRRSATQSSTSSSSTVSSSSSSTSTFTATVTTPTTSSNLSLSSILPNAPTVSKVASLPRIPKLSSSSSNTSINRTSSLDPASGTSLTTAGTKSNNSYNTGPAGRPNPGTTLGPGGGRPPGSSASTFNYNSSRPAAPSSGGNRPSFNTNRPPAHRQTSSVVNSGQGGPQKSSGPRIQNPTSGNAPGGGHKVGVNPINSHKTSSSFSSNAVVKSNVGSSSNNPNVPQKSYGSGAKSNSMNSKINNSFMGQKSSSGSGSALAGQKHGSQNAHSSNSNRLSGSSSNVNRSPTASGATKSPSSGKSPNISGSGRSPSLSSSGKSPSITSSNKSPNISHVSRSPNINSSSSGRSPNINPSRSPSIPGNATRSFNPSFSSKSPSSQKQSSSVIKSPNVNKASSVVNVSKTQSSSSSSSSLSSSSSPSSSVSQRSNSISGSIKVSQAKSVTKTTMVSPSMSTPSNSQQLSSSKTASTPHTSPNINNKLSGSGTLTLSSPSLSAMDSAISDSLSQKPAATQLQTSSSSSQSVLSTSTLSGSPVVRSNSCEPSELSLGNSSSKSAPVVQDSARSVPSEKQPISTSSTPTTPRSADCNKSKFSFPSSRGRKNLSAIVDQLKQTVGSNLDQSGGSTFSSDSQTGSNNKESVGAENVKPEGVVVSSLKQDETILTSPFSGTDGKPLAASGNLDTKPNHLLDSLKTVHKEMPGKILDSPIKELSTKESNREAETAKRTNIGIKCDQVKKNEEKSPDICRVVDSEHSLDLTPPKNSPVNSKVESLLGTGTKSPNTNEDSKLLVGKVRDRPSSLKLPMSHSPSPTNHSPATPSGRISSPSASSFQPLQSPSSLKRVSPLTVPNVGSVKNDDQVFKIPSIKPAGDHSEEDTKASNCAAQSTETKNSQKTDRDSSGTAGDNHKSRNPDLKKCGSVEKQSSSPPASPLSDSSSPENGLVIDDEESPRMHQKTANSKLSSDNNGSSGAKGHGGVKVTKEESDSTSNNSAGDEANSPHLSSDSTSVLSSPKTSRPPSAKSPALAKSLSGASTPKGSDSPCEIDDDLMDEALGFGS